MLVGIDTSPFRPPLKTFPPKPLCFQLQAFHLVGILQRLCILVVCVQISKQDSVHAAFDLLLRDYQLEDISFYRPL